MFQSLLVIPQYLLSFSSLVLEPQIFRRAMAIQKKDHISQPPLLLDDYICLFSNLCNRFLLAALRIRYGEERWGSHGGPAPPPRRTSPSRPPLPNRDWPGPRGATWNRAPKRGRRSPPPPLGPCRSTPLLFCSSSTPTAVSGPNLSPSALLSPRSPCPPSPSALRRPLPRILPLHPCLQKPHPALLWSPSFPFSLCGAPFICSRPTIPAKGGVSGQEDEGSRAARRGAGV